MIKIYERLVEIERAAGTQPGVVKGVLATDGEASDGHILNIEGLEADVPKPLLFGHNAYDPWGNLGSWTEFSKTKHALKGSAQIELNGVGANAEMRNDVAHMVAQGHIRMFSVRWSPLVPPIRRTELDSTHPAFVDSAKEKDWRKLYGMWFEKASVDEGSIVTLGADPKAILGRMRDSQGHARSVWRDQLEETLRSVPAGNEYYEPLFALKENAGRLRALGVNDFGTLLRLTGDDLEPGELFPVEYGEGKRILIPREAYLHLMRESDSRLRLAFDLLFTGDNGNMETDGDEESDEPEIPVSQPARQKQKVEVPGESPVRPLPEEAVRGIVKEMISSMKDETLSAVRQMATSLRR